MKPIDELLYRIVLGICAIGLLTALPWIGFGHGTLEWKWDLGGGLITLAATLIGVYAGFQLDRIVEKQRDRNVYATELDAALFDLATLMSSSGRVRGQVERRQPMIDELGEPTILKSLLRSAQFRLHASYPLVFSATTIAPLVASVEAKLIQCRRAPHLINVPLMTKDLRVLDEAIEFVEHLIEGELKETRHGDRADGARQTANRRIQGTPKTGACRGRL